MNLTAQLNKEEITQAIEEFVAKQGFDLAGKEVDIDMVATRKPKGFTATVTIGNASSPVKKEEGATQEDEPVSENKKDPISKDVVDPELQEEQQETADNEEEAQLEAETEEPDAEESLFG